MGTPTLLPSSVGVTSFDLAPSSPHPAGRVPPRFWSTGGCPEQNGYKPLMRPLVTRFAHSETAMSHCEIDSAKDPGLGPHEKVLVIAVKPRAMSMMFFVLIPPMSGRSVNIKSFLG